MLGKWKIMKSKLGTTLRKVRKGKQVSLCSVADEHLSKSQISRFERGESEISCIRLINILDKLHITLDELLILHDKDYINTESFTNLVQYIRKQYSSQSIDNISRLWGMYKGCLRESMIWWHWKNLAWLNKGEMKEMGLNREIVLIHETWCVLAISRENLRQVSVRWSIRCIHLAFVTMTYHIKTVWIKLVP